MGSVNGKMALEKMFVARTHHRRLVVATTDASTGSRVGGRPPASLAASPPRCPRCGGTLEYLLTLAGDVLGEAIAQGQVLSLLCCRDLLCRMISHMMIDVSSLVLVTHPDSSRAAEESELDSLSEGRRLTLGPIEEDPHDETGRVAIDDSKLGGQPWYLLPWGEEEASKAHQRGGDFLLQWSENAYPRDMQLGHYPFLFGVVYVYCRVNPDSKLPELADLSAFWQNT